MIHMPARVSSALRRLLLLALILIMVLALVPARPARAETIISSNITQNTNWNGTYRVTNSISLASGARLTIQPGTVINFEVGAGIDCYGQLLALGETANPVAFTSDVGNWRGLKFLDDDPLYGPSELWGTIIEMGGSQGGSVMVDNARILIANSEIRMGVGDGVRGYAGGTAIVSDTMITGQAGYALSFSDPSIDPHLARLQATSNGHNVIALTGGGSSLGQDRLWENAGLPYEILGTGFSVAKDETLTIEPGVTVRFSASSSLSVAGRLIAAGTPEGPITFSGVSPTPGFWGGINLIGSSTSPATAVLSYAAVEYGGSGTAGGNLRVENARAVVQYSRIQYSAAYGVHVANGGLPDISYSQITDNALGGVKTLRGDIQIPALNNWWGDASGPFHPSTNPLGLGNSVSDNVLYDPWLTDPALAGPGAARPAKLQVQVVGRATFAPGSRQTYAFAYRNGTSSTITNAVLVAYLPNTAYYLANEGGGFYWAARDQVFWRLGNLPPGKEGIVAFSVEYAWGIPLGVSDAVTAAIAGSNAPNDLVAVNDYLTFTPPVLTRTTLSQSAVDALLAGSLDANWLYTQAVNEGFQWVDAFANSQSDGKAFSEINLVKVTPPLTYQTIIIQPSGVVARSFNKDSYTIRTSTSMLLFDPQTQAWIDQTSNLQLSPVIPSQTESFFSKCMSNCVQEMLKSKIAGKLMPVAEVAEQVADCVEAGNDTGNTTAVINCGKNIGSHIPLIGNAIDYGTDLGVCNSDCQGDPSSHVCTEDQSECNSGLSALINPAVVTRKCDTETGLYYAPTEVSCGALGVSKCVIGADGRPQCKNCFADSPRFNPSSQDFSQLQLVQSSGALSPEAVTADDGQDVACPLCSPPKDPNAKLGVEGLVAPGQTLTYTVQYENVGSGEAFGVFVMDRLAAEFDEASLNLGNGGTYLSGSRTILWNVGTLAPKGQAGSKGEFTFSVNLRSNLSEGTVIVNQATVYFPSAPEVTPTNPVVNLVQPLTGSDLQVNTSAGQPVAFTLHGISAGGGALSFTISQPPAFGAISGTPPALTYTPMEGFSGADHLYFTVSNGSETSQPAQVILSVQPDPNDVIPPQLVASAPANGGVISTRTHALRAKFSEGIDGNSINGAAVALTRSGQSVSVRIFADALTHTVWIVPQSAFTPGSYTLQLAPPLADLAGNPLSQTYLIAFTVQGAGSVFLPLTIR